jgi:hypothetical protein
MIVSSEEESFPLANNLSVDEITERLHVMQHQESTNYKVRDYIRKASRSTRQHRELSVDPECRAKMCEWCYQVADYSNFSRQTVAMSMVYLDRFMSSRHPTSSEATYSKKKYQLAAMTCLYVAVKLFEPMAMDTALLSEISHGCYDEDDIEMMEQDILQALGWKMNGPTAHDVLSHLIMLLPKETSFCDNYDSVASALFDFSRFQSEIAVSDYELALEKPSVVAFAAILNSAEGISEKLFSAKSRFQYLQLVTNLTDMNPFSAKVNAVRIRLLTLFEINSGYNLPQIASLTPVVYAGQALTHSKYEKAGTISPVSVVKEALPERYSGSRTRARCA